MAAVAVCSVQFFLVEVAVAEVEAVVAVVVKVEAVVAVAFWLV